MIKYAVINNLTEIFVEKITCDMLSPNDHRYSKGEPNYLVKHPLEYYNEVWYSHSVFDNKNVAVSAAVKLNRCRMESSARRENKELSEMDCFIKAVNIIKKKVG